MICPDCGFKRKPRDQTCLRCEQMQAWTLAASLGNASALAEDGSLLKGDGSLLKGDGSLLKGDGSLPEGDRSEKLVAVSAVSVLEQACAGYEAAVQAWVKAPLDRAAQTQVNKAVQRGRLAWRIYQRAQKSAFVVRKDASGVKKGAFVVEKDAFAKKDPFAGGAIHVPSAFQERLVFRDLPDDDEYSLD